MFFGATFQYFFRYCVIGNFDILKSIFWVRFVAKELKFGLLPIFFNHWWNFVRMVVGIGICIGLYLGQNVDN